MKTKSCFLQYFAIILIVTLTACGAPSTPPVATSLPTFTRILATPTKTPPPTLIPPPSVALDGLRVAYVLDGNLFVQDSGKQPVQLTHSGENGKEDRFPIFSDDGEKIIFERGTPITYAENGGGVSSAVPQHVDRYLMSVDGGPEQILLPAGILTRLNLGYSKFSELCDAEFLPDTHNLLFDTCEVKPWTDGLEHSSLMDTKWNQDVLILNTDTMQIKRMLAPGKDGGMFYLSPDKKLSMQYVVGYIDVVGTYGQIPRRHMIPYLPEWDNEWRDAIWAQDSSKFTYVAPINGNGDGTDGYGEDTIWQYSMKKGKAVEIRLNPAPIGDNYIFSPDENWVVYGYPGAQTETYTSPIGVYLGNLRDGSSRLITPEVFYGLRLPEPNQWSPDSQHFFFYDDSETKMYIGNINGDITLLNDTGLWAGWLDSQRYLYKKDDLMVGEIGKEGAIPVVSLPAGLKGLYPNYFTYIFVKRP